MRVDFRIGLLVGLVAILTIGLYCIWLWQPPRQIERYTQNLFHKIEQKNWAGVADLIGAEYADQWGNDRALVLERMRLVLGYGHHLRLNVIDSNCKIDNGGGGSRATWTGKSARVDEPGGESINGIGLWLGRIAIDSDDAELVAVVKERVNSMTVPFELQWRHVSSKSWDWKLVRVSNAELEIPAGFD